MNNDLKQLIDYLRIGYPAEISANDARNRFSGDFITAANACGLFSQTDFLRFEPETGLEVYSRGGRLFVFDDESEEGSGGREVPKELLEAWKIDLEPLVEMLNKNLQIVGKYKSIDVCGLWDLGHRKTGEQSVHLFLSILSTLVPHLPLLRNVAQSGVSKVFVVSSESLPFQPNDVPVGVELFHFDEAFGIKKRMLKADPEKSLIQRMTAIYRDVGFRAKDGLVTLRGKQLGHLKKSSLGHHLFERLMKSYGAVVSYHDLAEYLKEKTGRTWESRTEDGWCHSIKNEEVVGAIGETVNQFIKPGKTKDNQKGYKICDLAE